MKSARLVVHFWIALALAGALAACDFGRGRGSPVQPAASVVPAPTSIELEGPGTVPPGGTARFTVTARLANGTSQDVTNQALWYSFTPSVLSIDKTGLAVAHQRGDTHLAAHFRTQQSTREVIVVPAGSYRLAGIVTESGTLDAVLVDALVEAAAGSGAVLSTTTGQDGRYRLYGVAGDTQVRVTKEGFQPRVLSVAVADHQTQNVEMSLVRPRDNVSGVYTLTITAAGGCREALPEEIRTRTYTAHLTQDGPNIEARLSGATFAVSRAGRGDHFRGRVEPDSVSFSLTPHIYKYYSYAQYPDLAEKLPTGYFVLDGSVVTRNTASRFSGTLDGSFQFFKFDPAWGGKPTMQCRGYHEFVLTRTGA